VWFILLGLGQRESLPVETTNNWQTGKTKSRYFATVPVDVSRNSVKPVSPGCRIVCKVLGPVLKSGKKW
jgi:hypothetical protein